MIKFTPLLDTLKLQKISDDIYFSEKYQNYISNSRLGLINPSQDGSPKKFFEGFKIGYSSSLEIGSAVHELTLQKDLFYLAKDLGKPTAKLGALADKLYPIYLERPITNTDINAMAAFIDYYKGNLSENRLLEVREKCTPYWDARKRFDESYTDSKEVIYLDSKSSQVVSNCVEALKSNTKVQKLLYPEGVIETPVFDTEQAILLNIKVEVDDKYKFIVRLKSKLDHYSIDKDTNTITVNDVKTIGKIVSEMQSNIDRYHYNREIAMYSWLLSLCSEKFYDVKNPTVKGNYLVVSTIPQYYTKVLPMTKKMFQEGWNEFKYLMELVVKAIIDYKDQYNFAQWI